MSIKNASLAVATLLGLIMNLAQARSVQHWTRFEHSLMSTEDYDNALQEVKLKVEFTAPSGKKRSLLGFWDGGRTWRVRFSPDQMGTWSFRSTCSDLSNQGLHDQSGSFECVPYRGNRAFFKHGELRLAENKRYMEHVDGTPFSGLRIQSGAAHYLPTFRIGSSFCRTGWTRNLRPFSLY